MATEFVIKLFLQWKESLPSSLADVIAAGTEYRIPMQWSEHTRVPAWVAWYVFSVDVFAWWVYYMERKLVKRKHMKFTAQKMYYVLAIHIISGLVETVLGLMSVLHPENKQLAYATAWVALCAHIPTNLMLSPHVWGLKYITVTGYIIVGLMRAFEAMNVLWDSHFSVVNLWILLQMATLVRVVSYFVAPWTSIRGYYGDLSTDKLVYTFTVGVASISTAAFVYSPTVLLLVIHILAIANFLFPESVFTGGKVGADAAAKETDTGKTK
jgi:hypothetical protein